MAADRVTAQLGVTRNLGNYNNVKIDFALESDVGPDETVDEALERVARKVESKVESELDAYEAD